MSMTTPELIELWKSSGMTYGQLADQTGLSKTAIASRVQRYLANHPEEKSKRRVKGNGNGSGSSVRLGEVKLPTAISETEFLKPFDWKGRLREGLGKLTPGSNMAVIRDDDFRRHLGIPEPKWRRLKRMDEFMEYQLQISGQSLYWCQPETASKLRSQIELADEVI